MGSFATQFALLSANAELTTTQADTLVLPIFQKEKKDKAKKETQKAFVLKDAVVWTALHQQIDKAMGGALSDALTQEKFKADFNKRRVLPVRSADGLKVRWVVVLGLGLPDKLDIQKATKAAAASIKDTFGYADVSHIVVALPEATKKLTLKQAAQAVVFGGTQATYKTAEAGEEKIHTLKKVSLFLGAAKGVSKADLETAQVIAQAEAWTKDLANKPANLKTAECLAEAARSLKGIPGVTVSVISDSKKIQKDMPAFWAVAQGAAKVDPPRFITVKYSPIGTKKPKKKIALVGKGVIFDTGGVQVKPGNSMNDMKFDMTGAATVLAVIKAAAQLELKHIEISAYVAATQNLTGEEAYLPDSIINSSAGKKIEIRHTDAEGRVTLADAVWKAAQEKPDEIITIATLTGSAMMAVGHCIALMGTDEKLVDKLDKRGKAIGETVQALELLDMDFDDIKSDRDAADLSNTGKSRSRGHLSAGAFVISFANDIPTAHLDIAGGDAKDGNATGIAVKGLIQYLIDEAH